ncbi:ribonuclease H-like domain-containing protein, partial [Tanacetum coccineum]
HDIEVAYLLIYVDDIILIASFIALLRHIISSLHQEFKMTDLGALNYFLGISVTCDFTVTKLGHDEDPVLDPTLYRSLAGGLQCLTFTRLDISYVLQKICRGAEVEYQGVANAVDECAWICNLLRELHTHILSATLVYYDNVNAIYLPANHVQYQRMKHIEIDIHFVCDMVTKGQA